MTSPCSIRSSGSGTPRTRRTTLWDDESWDLLCTRHVQLLRAVGALNLLPLALSARIGLHLFAGELAAAAGLVGEVAALSEATAKPLPPYGELALAAWRGREPQAIELIA